eukprot:6608051-Heterocapsa_arctica.AAC.1
MYIASKTDYTTPHSSIANCGRLDCPEGRLRSRVGCGPCLQPSKRWRPGSSAASRCDTHREEIMEEMKASIVQARALASSSKRQLSTWG